MATNAARSLYRLYVANIPWTVSHNELRKHFSKFGHLNLATVSFDRNTGLSKNFGFVLFSTKEGYESALNTSHKLEGSTLRVQRSISDNDSDSSEQ